MYAMEPAQTNKLTPTIAEHATTNAQPERPVKQEYVRHLLLDVEQD